MRRLSHLLKISFLFTISSSIKAQQLPIEFSYSQKDFEFLDSPVYLNGEDIWGMGYSEVVDLGFIFTVAGNDYDKIIVRSGEISFFESDTTSISSRRLFSLRGILEDRGETESVSPISYQYEYSTEYEENIFKVEWKNAGIYNLDFLGLSSSPEDFVNIQVWLHEISGNICIHFGPHLLEEQTYLNNLDEAGVLGIKLLIGEDFIGPIGDGDAPESVIDICALSCWSNINSYPSEGMVYCFSPSAIVSSKSDLIKERGINLQVIPNPAHDEIRIVMQNASDYLNQELDIEIVDIAGKKIRTERVELSTGQLLISLQDFLPGTYFVRLITDDKKIVKKVIKL